MTSSLVDRKTWRMRNMAQCHRAESSTSVFWSTPNGDPKRIRKIDEMLPEIGLKLFNGRLPWSTLDADLRKKGYMTIIWPHGVVRDRDKGVSGLSAEDMTPRHRTSTDEWFWMPMYHGQWRPKTIQGVLRRSTEARSDLSYCRKDHLCLQCQQVLEPLMIKYCDVLYMQGHVHVDEWNTPTFSIPTDSTTHLHPGTSSTVPVGHYDSLDTLESSLLYWSVNAFGT
ncbi:hypothetical protein L210DRAFT_3652849 [Boletus edulis BED1]|uniref:Uncharacterized protein n=1 Tax=Boletus edulis BED1 TaxID=1328754 RepID=A0AAD4G7K2_BOLED|nr:hypothetical protein L210DRAFT_3652849 [Boletus edulis BED1]